MSIVRNNIKKLASAAIIAALLFVAFFQITMVSAAPKQTVILTYSQVGGMSDIFWGSTANILTNAGYRVVKAMPASVDFTDYTKQLVNQIRAIPGSIIVAFSASDLVVLAAALETGNLVKRIILVSSNGPNNPFYPDSVVLGQAVHLSSQYPDYIYGPIFAYIDTDRGFIGSLLDGLTVNPLSNRESIITMLSTPGTNGLMYSLAAYGSFVIKYDWTTVTRTLHQRNIPITGIYGDAAPPELAKWYLDNTIPSRSIVGAKHLLAMEKPKQFTDYLLWQIQGFLA